MADAARRRLLQAVGVGAAGLGLTAAGFTFAGASKAAPLETVARGRVWLNTQPLRAADFAGKVLLVNFWTYSCINSLRALPFMRDWASKYRDRGLIVLGVHAPEFAFEHDATRVARALIDQGVSYPNVLDNDYAIWNAFNNEAWPGFFLVDTHGRVRHNAFGEGVYAELERVLQGLLEERGVQARDRLSGLAGEGAQLQADWNDLQSPETYVGADKAEHFTGGALRPNALTQYRAAQNLAVNQWTLSGGWTIGPEFSSPDGQASAIRFRFHARDLHLVMGRDPAARPVRYRIKIDGAAPGSAHGVDTDAGGNGAIDADRMYQLVRQPGPIAPRTFEIAFLDPGARVYVFTFG